MGKTLIFMLVALVAFRTFADVDEHQMAEPPAEMPRKYLLSLEKNLNQQSLKIQNQASRICEASFEHIFRKDEVHFSLFYGYNDSDYTVKDGFFSQFMTEHLLQPCGAHRPHVETCGFQLVRSEKGIYQLKKKMSVGKKEKTIIVDVSSPSVSWSMAANSDVKNLYFDQKKKSERIEESFYQALKDSDVVFYNGHSRVGAGPDFRPRDPVRLVHDHFTKERKKKMLDAVNQSSNLKIFGLFSCESEKYYESDLLKAAPQLGLLVTTDDVSATAAEESILGSLNSILTRQCKSEFAQSTIPATAPEEDFIRIKNFFEYSRSQPSQSQTSKITKANGTQ